MKKIKNRLPSIRKSSLVIITIITLCSFFVINIAWVGEEVIASRVHSSLRPLAMGENRKEVSHLRALAVAERRTAEGIVTPPEAHDFVDIQSFDADADKEWNRLVADRWHEGVDYEALFSGARVVVFADTDHSWPGIGKGFIRHIDELRAAGIKCVGLEAPSNIPIGDIYALAEEYAWIPFILNQFVDKVRSLYPELVFIDMPANDTRRSLPEPDRSFQRGVYMGNKIVAYLKKNPDAKMAVIAGYGHVRDRRQIAQQLENNNIAYRAVAVVSEGQRGWWQGQPVNNPLYMLSVVKAVANRAEPAKRYGYVDLSGLGLCIDGVIHFERLPLEATGAQPLPLLLGFQTGTRALTLREQIASLGGVEQIAKPFHVRFPNEELEPNAQYWQATNQQKIARFVLQLEGLTVGQQLYLTVLLSSYVEMQHQGSIVELGFVPNGQTFEVIAIDLHGYKPKAGSAYSRYELELTPISIKQLQREFGFSDMLVEAISDLPTLEISYNPARPTSVINMFPFILAAVRMPDRIMVWKHLGLWPRLRVYCSRRMIAELEVEDFLLSPAEETLVSIERLLEDANSTCDNRLIFELEALQEKARPSTRWFSWLTPQGLRQRRIRNSLDVLSRLESAVNGFIFSRAKSIPWTILSARCELRYLNMAEIDRHLLSLDEIINIAEPALRSINRLCSKYPDIAETTYPDGRKMKDIVASLESGFQQIAKLKGAAAFEVETERAVTPTPQPLIEGLKKPGAPVDI